jgi:hypothetical protein
MSSSLLPTGLNYLPPTPQLEATETAYVKQVDNTILVNTGSAGQHCYGETRASYAQVVWQNGRWHAETIYLNYDMAATERAFYQSGFMNETGPIAHLIFQEWKTAQTILPDWRNQYMQAVLGNEIDLETSVINTLAKYGLNGLTPRSAPTSKKYRL